MEINGASKADAKRHAAEMLQSVGIGAEKHKRFLGVLTQLINNRGILICTVGTPESAVFFLQAMQLARRSLGLQYDVACADGICSEFAVK